MVDDISPAPLVETASVDDIRRVLDLGRAGEVVAGATFIDTEGLDVVRLPEVVVVAQVLVLDDAVILVLADGAIIVLFHALDHSFTLVANGIDVPSDILVDIAVPAEEWSGLISNPTQVSDSSMSGGPEIPVFALDPLVGLDINPLLLPVIYDTPDRPDDRYGETEGPRGFQIVPLDTSDVVLAETDGPVSFRMGDYFTLTTEVSNGDTSSAEVSVTLADLPIGTMVSYGTLTTTANGLLTLVAKGSAAEIRDLLITFPADFSTDSRSDLAPGALAGVIRVTSRFGDDVSLGFSIGLTVEGDITLDGPGVLDLIETDTSGDFRPVDVLTPRATDADGSESVSSVALDFSGLPTGTLVSYDGGANFVAIPGAVAFIGTLAQYETLVIRLPEDFSTANPATNIVGTLTAQTDEGGAVSGSFTVALGFELDVELSVADAALVAVEDGDGVDGGGVTVDLGIAVAATDLDGSEDSTTVEIAFDDLPDGATFSLGTFDAVGGLWTGSMAEANLLTLHLPGDFATAEGAPITATVRAISPEGEVETPLSLTVTPAGDIDFGVSPLITAETDDEVTVRPADVWQASISDADASETIDAVTLTLADLPAGVQIATPDGGTVTFNAAAGGDFVFVGTYAAYASLTLTFPADFSTESPVPDATISGTLSVTSNEDSTGQSTPVTLTITLEGDVTVDNSKAYSAPSESDAAQVLRPFDVISAMPTDADGSESLAQLVLTVEGLPARDQTGAPLDPLPPVDGTYLSLNAAGGVAVFSLAADGSVTMTLTLDAATVGDVAAAYAAVSLTLPQDFSTANRSDLSDASGATAKSLTFQLSALTDEDQDATTDGLADGQMTRQRTVDIGFELDVELSAPALLDDSEDSWGGDESGVRLDLGIAVSATDIDGSEDSTTVEITYTDMPPFAYFNGGSFDTDSGVWTGTMAEASDLILTLPGDYSGTITSVIRAISPEGTTQTDQTIRIAPTGDVDFDIDDLVAAETDAPVVVSPASAWAVSVSDGDPGLPVETLDTITLTLDGLPAGVVTSGVADSAITYDTVAGGTLIFSGSGTDYAALQLRFPTDYSTEQPAAGTSGALTGTISATSSEDPTGGQDVAISLRITAEGDVTIDTLADEVPDETDGPTPVTPSALLLPATTDLDGSETLEAVLLEIQGLPGGSTFASLGLSLPTGAEARLEDTPNGSATAFVLLTQAQVGDVLQAYTDLAFALPADFSTANRSDLTSDTSLPLTMRLSVLTDEEADLSIDSADDGIATVERVVTIDFEADLTLSAPTTLSGTEDARSGDGSGVEIALGIDIAPNDIDGSEDVISVEIQFMGLPADTVFLNGTDDLSGRYSAATGLWQGTEAEAEALSLRFPGDYSGTVTLQVRAASPEGAVLTDQVIEIAPAPDVDFSIADSVLAETDLAVSVIPSQDWQVSVSDFDPNLPEEQLDSITLTLDGLPPGVSVLNVPSGTVAYDVGAGGTFVFSGTTAQYAALEIVFPADFSTDMRGAGQGADGAISGTLSAVSTEGSATVGTPVSLTITPEGDVTVDNTKAYSAPSESDAAQVLRPFDVIAAMPTDADGSESLAQLVLTVEGLPARDQTGAPLDPLPPVDGTYLSLNAAGGVAVFSLAADGSVTMTLTLDAATVGDVAAAYAAVSLTLPQDFSTANRSDLSDASGATAKSLTFQLSALTDEDQDATTDGLADGQMTRQRTVDIGFELDVELSVADAALVAVEDGDGVDGGGVTVDLGIAVAATDLDGSEDSTTVEIAFDDLSDGVTFSLGTFDAVGGLWTGSMAEANLLTLHLPGDFATAEGTPITATVRAISPEGEVETPLSLTVTPAGDIDFDVSPLITAETDDEVTVRPADVWQASISDADASETIDAVTLTLADLPAGVQIATPDGGTVTFNAAAGGDFVFVGTYAAYASLTLTFPADFSTESPVPDATISGRLSVTSNEDSTGQSTPVTLTITPEGDVGIDDSAPFADRIEDDPAIIRPAGLLAPLATDADGSEALQTLVLVIEGLPATDQAGDRLVDPIDGTYLQLSVDAGAEVDFTRAADGSVTLSITLSEGAVTDIAAAYDAISFVLPEDFSTENRVDLGAVPPEADLPLTFRLSAQTDEDVAAGVASDPDADPNDGWTQSERVLTVAAQEDITLSAPATLSVAEDGGVVDSAAGVSVDLGISLSIDDQDGSESEEPASDFAATVQVLFFGLPSGSTIPTGGTFDPIANAWSGTVAEANALSVTLPGNVNGSFDTVITVETPEGTETARQTIEVTPTADVIGGGINAAETDDILQFRIGDTLDINNADGGNPNVTAITSVTITDLPYDVSDADGNFYLLQGGVPVGTLAPDGTFTWTPATPLSVAEAEDLVMVFPKDYSTETPATFPVASFGVEPTSEDAVILPIIIVDEGDVVVPDATVSLAETDAVVTFTPAYETLPQASDVDGSESITQITLVFNGLPDGARVSLDGGATFGAVTSNVFVLSTDAGGTALDQYAQFTIELPTDFSTQNPASDLFALIGASTDEGGYAVGQLTVTVAQEEDLMVSGDGAVALAENDVPGDNDEDSTTQAPRVVVLADAWDADVTDTDGSESIQAITVDLDNLPDGAEISIDGGLSFAVLGTNTYTAVFDTLEAYRALVIRLPDDFSTESRGPAQGTNGPITGTVNFTTDETGDQTEAITITVDAEADVRIDAATITEDEDFVGPAPVGQGQTIALNLSMEITDVDGSETLQTIDVSFDGLPISGAVISDGITDFTLTGPSGTLSNISQVQLNALEITGLAPHFSGTIDVTVAVQTNEGGTTSETFVVNIEPVAEPVIDLSVDLAAPDVTEAGTGAYVVKEDSQFALRIAASTPDVDGSEELVQIVIENIPEGWLPSGTVPDSLFTGDVGQIADATMSGTTLTLTLSENATSFDGTVLLTPLANDDGDLDGLAGAEIVATVTAQDVATGLTTNSASASDTVDVDVDAVVDPIANGAADSAPEESTSGALSVPLNLGGIALTDTDGSETFTQLTFALSVATASDDFDVSRDLGVTFSDAAYADVLDITLTPITDTTATVTILPVAGVTTAQFTDALAGMSAVFPQYFSGVMSLDGTLEWAETNLSGNEYDTADNAAQQTFSITQTIAPIAQTDLRAGAFVLRADEVASDSALAISGQTQDGSVSVAEILTLLESTDDGSSPAGGDTPADGQVQLFLSLEGSTPDADGSEELDTLVIQNIPTSWIAESMGTGGAVEKIAFFALDGQSAIAQDEWDKVDSAIYDEATGSLTITFVDDVTAFSGALGLTPTLYEDYDVDRAEGDPFTADGVFFGDDLKIELTARDTNTVTDDEQGADVTLDVDVDPVNNFAVIVLPVENNEQEIDDAGGIAAFQIIPELRDMDGSEQITALVLRNVPSSLTIYVTDTDNPSGPKVPALITSLDSPSGFNTWSLEANYDNGVIQWDDIEVHGIATHFAGDVAESVDVVTTEDDGTTRVTNSEVAITVDPVADGGDPSESGATQEDTAVHVPIDGNIIDNAINSPGSPEAIYDVVRLENIPTDSLGRSPRFFDGDPATGGTEVFPTAGQLILAPDEAENLWILPAEDSNETLQLDITILYYETIEPTETTLGTGTITVDVLGIADTPIVSVQASDPADGSNPTVDEADVDASYKDGDNYRYDLIYGYAGYGNTVFRLDQTLSEAAVRNGYDAVDAGSEFDTASTLAGQMTEVTDAVGNYDGSETIYYFITGVEPGTVFIGGTPLDATGETYLVPGDQLADLQFAAEPVSEVTYYEMQLHAIVVEDDQEIGTLPGPDADANLAYLNSLPGGAVVSQDFAIVVLPNAGGEDLPCGDNQKLPTPTLSLVGSGDEDTEIAFQIKMETVPGFYDSIDDLVTLPNGVIGSFTLALDLPEGATLSSDPSGAVFIDPASGEWIVDLAKLGVDPSDPTQTAGSILFTPPEHQSSPDNPFDTDETLGPDDPYDSLDTLGFSTELVNVNCKTTHSTTGTFDIVINPVVDGPDIALLGAAAFDEDTAYDLNLEISQIDGGERLVGDVEIALTGGGTDGARLFLADGTEVTASNGVFSVAADMVAGLYLTTTEHFGGGTVQIQVSATSEDIDGTTKENTATRTIEVIAVADVPVFDFDTTVLDPDTGLPYIDISASTPVVTMIEDIPFLGFDVVQPNSPDQDGSETTSIVIDLSNAPGLTLTGPTGSGFIDNGDGTYTISQNAFTDVFFSLDPEHARTPDAINGIVSEFPITVTIQTLELSNADTNTSSQDFILRVRPDADVPVLTASIDATTGVEDQPDAFELTLSATTPDPHETMEFRITLPVDVDGTPLGVVQIDGVTVAAVDGVVNIPATLTGGAFAPSGAVTYVPAADFGGDAGVSVVAVTLDSVDVDAIYLDTQASAPIDLALDITPAPDLGLTVETPSVVLQETDADVVYDPAGDFLIEVTDVDGSEYVDNVTYTLVGVPDGTSWTAGSLSGTASSGALVFDGSLADFETLQITFPADFATNDTPVTGSIAVTTNESGSETGAFSITVDGELDLVVSTQTPIMVAETGAPVVVEFGIDADITPDVSTNTWETLEEVQIVFSSALAAGTTATAGSFDAARTTLTVTRGATDIATFAALVAALAITVPAGTATALDGEITVSTNHGTSAPQAFEVTLNDAPVPGPDQSFDMLGVTSQTIAASDLLAGAMDPEGNAMTLANPSTDDPSVIVALTDSGDVSITVPAGYAGTPVLSVDIVDDGTPAASATTTATLNIDSLQMIDTGLTDSEGRAILSDVTGATGGDDVAQGTDGDDAVILDGTRPYAEVESFALLGGNDLIDLSAASSGYSVDGGSGDDVLVGSGFADRLAGGDGADTLTGGAGNDVFVVSDLTLADVITDYGQGNDVIDLTELVQLADGETIGDRVDYGAATGRLSVDGTTVARLAGSGDGIPASVDIIFEDAVNQQQTATI